MASQRTFNLDHEECGVNIGSTQAIIRVGQITVMPNAPDFVKGVINPPAGSDQVRAFIRSICKVDTRLIMLI